MSQVEFDEFETEYEDFDETPKMVRWVVSHSFGLIRGNKQANYFFVLVFLVSLIIFLFVIFSLGENTDKLPQVPEDHIPVRFQN